MNREILFGGKRKDNGEWVEGYYTELPCGSLGATIFSNDDELVCEDTKSYIIKVFTKQHTNYSNSNPLQVIECEKYEVIPETVRQFTGLTDKNGKKIFEGDIVRYETIDRNGYDGIYKVVFEDRNGCGYFGIAYSDIETCFFCYSVPASQMEVIGNIYDSPELLRSKNG